MGTLPGRLLGAGAARGLRLIWIACTMSFVITMVHLKNVDRS